MQTSCYNQLVDCDFTGQYPKLKPCFSSSGLTPFLKLAREMPFFQIRQHPYADLLPRCQMRCLPGRLNLTEQAELDECSVSCNRGSSSRSWPSRKPTTLGCEPSSQWQLTSSEPSQRPVHEISSALCIALPKNGQHDSSYTKQRLATVHVRI